MLTLAFTASTRRVAAAENVAVRSALHFLTPKTPETLWAARLLSLLYIFAHRSCPSPDLPPFLSLLPFPRPKQRHTLAYTLLRKFLTASLPSTRSTNHWTWARLWTTVPLRLRLSCSPPLKTLHTPECFPLWFQDPAKEFLTFSHFFLTLFSLFAHFQKFPLLSHFGVRRIPKWEFSHFFLTFLSKSFKSLSISLVIP